MVDQAVICVGNPARSDDALAARVAWELERHNPGVPIHTCDGDPGELLELWEGLDRAVLVDAVVTGGAEAGTIHVLEAGTEPLPIPSAASTHGIGLAETIELARTLGRLPQDVRVVGIEAGSLDPGVSLTPEVEAAIPRAVDQVLQVIRSA